MLGDYGGYIVAAYLAVTLGVAALISWVLIDARRLARELARIEAARLKRGGEREDER